MKNLTINQYRFKAGNTLKVLIPIILVTTAFAMQIGINKVNYAKAQEYEQAFYLVSARLNYLDKELEVATASGQPQQLNDNQVKGILSVMMPSKDIGRFMKVLSCENKDHSAIRTHLNSDGSLDIGVTQVNSSHQKEVESMFGTNFYEAMKEPISNIVYAAYLYQHQGLTPWTCNNLI